MLDLPGGRYPGGWRLGYHMSRLGFYGKDQSEARKTGLDWPILPSKDLFWLTPLPEVILPSFKRAISLPDVIMPFFWGGGGGGGGKPAQPARKCARFAATDEASMKATSIESSSARTAMARSWATLFCLRWVVITSSCSFLWRQNGEP